MKDKNLCYMLASYCMLVSGCVINADPDPTPQGIGGPEYVDESEQALSTWECIGDNDWTGSTACFKYSGSFGYPWIHSSANGYFGDMEYTTSTSAFGNYDWQSLPKDGLLEVWAYIPSTNATAKAEYWFGCNDQLGFVNTVDQNLYYNQWVKVGVANAWKGYDCNLGVTKSNSATASSKLAADAVKIKILY